MHVGPVDNGSQYDSEAHVYGLVNKAIEGMVRDGHGEAVWKRIRDKAGLQTQAFVSNEPYPDEVTYSLVAAASEVLDTPAEDILKLFGHYWVLETAVKAYGPLMRTGGRTLKDFLLYLPRFHIHVETIFPELRPPEFTCANIGEGSLDLHYSSPRPPGLEPFVEGLVEGLGKLFETPVTIRLLRPREGVSDVAVFRVTWEPKDA